MSPKLQPGRFFYKNSISFTIQPNKRKTKSERSYEKQATRKKDMSPIFVLINLDLQINKTLFFNLLINFKLRVFVTRLIIQRSIVTC